MAEETLSQAAIDALLAGSSGADEATPPPPPPPPAPEPEPVQEAEPAMEPEPVPVAEEPAPAPEVIPESPSEPVEPVVAAESVPSEPRPETQPAPGSVASEPVPTVATSVSSDALANITGRIEKAEAAMDKLSALEVEVKTSKQQSGMSPEYVTRLESLEHSLLSICQIQQDYTRDPDLDKIPKLEKELAKANDLIETLSGQLQNLQNKLQNATEEISRARNKLNGTWGYDIQNSFECQSCGARGHVVGLVKCSECGDEDWWGWWPPEYDVDETDVAFSREDDYR